MKQFQDSKEKVVGIINDHRGQKDVSVKALAKEAECSQSGLNAVLAGQRGVSFDLLLVTLQAMGYSVDVTLRHRVTGTNKIKVL